MFLVLEVGTSLGLVVWLKSRDLLLRLRTKSLIASGGGSLLFVRTSGLAGVEKPSEPNNLETLSNER